jgi:hypothetical protein
VASPTIEIAAQQRRLTATPHNPARRMIPDLDH